MNDLISRQAAIDAVNAWFRLYAINRTMSNVTSIQDILRLLPSAQQWIPCSERLPDMYRRYYLVSLADNKEVDIAYFTEYGTWETFRNDEVETWMPLPEPYKGKEE